MDEVLRQAAVADSTAVPDDGDQDLLLLYDEGEEILMAKRSSGMVVESRLSPDERVQFELAKKKACDVFFENAAWKTMK